jgi:general stress protein 26
MREIIEAALNLASRSFTAELGTLSETGSPQVKALIKTKQDGLNTFWFCSNTSSRRAAMLARDGRACLYFFDPKTFEGLMLEGRAEVTRDPALLHGFWQDGMERYYPAGPDDPDYCVIVFRAEKGNYYRGMKNTDFAVE